MKDFISQVYVQFPSDFNKLPYSHSYYPPLPFLVFAKFISLTVDPTMRPMPAAMLEHRWISNMMRQEVDMARWIRQVWGWPQKPSTLKRGQ